MNSILIIEDERDINDRIKAALSKEHYQVYQAYNGISALDFFEGESIDLILLDMMLPDIKGEDILKNIRMSSKVPIIIISALNDEFIQYSAYENEIDDYVVKPFSMNLLLYKIKAVLRRCRKQNETIKYKGISLEVDNYIVSYKEEPIILTAKEFEILQLLLINKGKVYSREEILMLVWGYDYYGDIRNIDVHIKNIRKKIPLQFINTVKGIGYRVDK